MTNKEFREVTVKEAAHDDTGRGIARLSLDTMKDLDLVSGDVIEIEGKRKAAAIVWPGFYQDTGKNILRIDGIIRSNAQAGIDDVVRIRKIEVEYARKVVIHPMQEIRLTGGEEYLKRVLRGRPITEGQPIRVSILGNPLTFVISKVSPKGVVIVDDSTLIELKSTPYEGEEVKRLGDIHYEDIGGLGREIEMVREMIELPLRHPELFERLGVEPPKGVLLYGPPGTGKTLIAKAVANEVDAHFISLSGPEIMSKYYGESEGKLREVFDEAQEQAPTIIFIDELDSIAPKREDTKGEVERRVVAQLLTLMDGLKGRGQVMVIGATNLPDEIDPALRRGGRFDREIEIGIPDKSGRLEIMQVHSRGVPLDLEGVELNTEQGRELSKTFAELGEDEGRKQEEKYKREMFLQPYADKTHGFVGADIALLVKESAMHALRKALKNINVDEEIPAEVLENIKVTREDYDEALKHVEPSAMREVLVEIPDVSWEDVGGLEEVKKDLMESVEWPLKYPQVFEKLRTEPPRGILLFGPPGTGKTLLAKAVANKSECNFISVKGPELLSKWVGESEKGVREVFRKARQASPSIIFFDEIDALLPKRGSYSGSSHVTESVVSQILTELDGMEELTDVTIIGATNRPDMLDDAMLRPGRLDRIIYVPPPDEESRRKIFEVYLRDAKGVLADEIDIEELVERTGMFVGADIAALVQEAKMSAIRHALKDCDVNGEITPEMIEKIRVTRDDFENAFSRVHASLDETSMEEHERRSWEILFKDEERSLLGDALSAARRAELMRGKEGSPGASELKKMVFARQKDLGAIRKKTTELNESLAAEE